MSQYLIGKCPKIANDRVIPSLTINNVNKRGYPIAGIIFIIFKKHNKENLDNFQQKSKIYRNGDSNSKNLAKNTKIEIILIRINLCW